MPKVLVADDNNNIQKMVTLALEERGVQVTSVGNGEAAVRRIPDLNPDLILADIFMPVRNGYEVCEFVKKDQRFSQIPVILLVGAFDPLDEKEARRVGADGVLKKPFVPPDPLIAMVLSVLEKNPRVAAELKKFKESKEVSEPHPVFESEGPAKSEFSGKPVIPTKAEPKPLPEFPEPSPEEAALIYGFGTGRRTLDDAQIAGSKEPPAPQDEVEEAADEEFDGASTAHDWRRTAMDFDVPADAANRPAFASTENFDVTAPFPSERDVPPRRVNVPEPEVPVVQEQVEAQSFDEAAASASIEAPAETVAPALPESGELPAAETAQEVQQAAESAPAAEETASKLSETPAQESESQATPSLSFNAPHWMDLVAKPTEYPEGGWMSRTSDRPVVSRVEASQAAPHEEPVAELPSPQSSEEEPIPADEPAAHAPSLFAAVPRVRIPPFEEDSEPFARGSSKADAEFEKEPEDAALPLSLKDPALVESPAVRVIPEPLLVDEEPRESGGYTAQAQETQPLYSFLTPDAAEETPVAADAETPLAEPAASEFDERIPTMPPPNRQALAEIPFLTPPPDFNPNARDNTGTGSEIVDAVVQKVMERLEPQLHDLLSQGLLKPLVENLLQNELTKKEK